MQKKTGVSLIVLVITVTIRYDKWLKASKMDKIPPANKIETMENLIDINRCQSEKYCFVFSIAN